MSSYVGNNGMQKQIMVVITCPQKQKTYNIEVEIDTTIGELGNELFSALDCQPDEQCVLYFNGQALSNDQTFQRYGVMKGNQIEIKIEKIVQYPPPQYHQSVQNRQQQDNNRSINYNQGGNQDPSNFMPNLGEINLTILVKQTQRKYEIKMKKVWQVKELTTRFTNITQMQNNQKVTFSYNGVTLAEVKTFESYQIPDQAIINANVETLGGFRQ